MLRKIRQPGRTNKGKTFKQAFSYFIFGLICFIFLFIAPMGSQLIGGAFVAKVGKERIQSRELRQIEENLKAQHKNRLNSGNPEEVEKLQNEIRSQAIKHLIDLYLMNIAAKKQGFFISDLELKDTIQSFAVFKEKDRFLYSRYLSFLKNQNLKPTRFENRIRKAKLAENWTKSFKKALTANQLETEKKRERYQYKINFEYALLKAEAIEEKKLNELLKAKNKKQVNAFIKSAKAKWEKTGVFSLGLPIGLPIAQNDKIQSALLSQLPNPGLIPKLIRDNNKLYVVNVLSFSQEKMKPEEERLELLLSRGFQKSSQILDSWISTQSKQIKIEKNPNI